MDQPQPSSNSSDTEKAASPAPSRVHTLVYVVEPARIMVMDASPSGTPRSARPRVMTLQKGDCLSVQQASILDNSEPAKRNKEPAKMPGGLGRSRKNAMVRSSLSEDSTASAGEASIELDGGSSGSGPRSNRFSRLRDNRFHRAGRRPDTEAVRTPPKRPRLGADLDHNVGSRITKVQTQAKLKMLESDQENQDPAEELNLWSC